MGWLSAPRAYPEIVKEKLADTSDRRHENRVQQMGLLIIGSAALVLALATASECRSVTHLPSLLYGAALWGWWGLLAGILWTKGPKTLGLLRLSPLNVTLILASGCLIATVHLMLLGSLSFVVPEWRVNAPPIKVLTGPLKLNRFGLEILICGFITGLIGVIQFHIRAQRETLRSLGLQRQLAAAQLQALQMQLEPHFLFNTLNAIVTLVELGRQSQAAEMLRHLNAILKRTLERTTPERIPLSQELETVENYLAIEQVRFADRLRVDIKVDPGALYSLVPCFLLQPIVENAIRHGVAHCEGSGLVEASARREGDRLRILVRDNGSGRAGTTKPGNGIGLRNTRERLAYFYTDQYQMQAGPVEAGGFEVAIDIPFERAR